MTGHHGKAAENSAKTRCPSCGSEYELVDGGRRCAARCPQVRYHKRQKIKITLFPDFTELKRIAREVSDD